MNWGTIIMWVWKAVKNRQGWPLGFLILALSLWNEVSAQASQEGFGGGEEKPVTSSFEGSALEGERAPSSVRRKNRVQQIRIKKKKIRVPKAKVSAKKIQKQVIKVAKPPRQLRRYFEAGTDEAELESVINQEIDQLFNLLKTTQRKDLRLRLGSLYVEKARFIEYRIYEKYDQQMERFEKGRTKVKPRLNLRPTFVFTNKAIALFETYLRQYPKDRNLDRVLYFLGVSYFKKGNTKQGKKHYEALVKRFPGSDHVHDAHFELGEYYFGLARWRQASTYYKKIIPHRSLRLYPFALYKLAWCEFKQNRVGRAMAHLEAVIREGVRQKNKGGKVHFAQEALTDVVLFFSRSRRRPTEALRYFESLSGSSKKAGKMLKNLAYTYLDHGRFANMRSVFKQLIEDSPDSPEAYEYQSQVVQSYTYSGLSSHFLRELKLWLNHYGPRSVWVKKNKNQVELLKKAKALMSHTVRNYALQMHQSFRKTKALSAKNQALITYGLYNEYFPLSDEMRFFYAELLFDLKKYKEAAAQYLYVVTHFKDSKWYEPSSLNSVLTLEKTLPSSAQIRKQVRGSRRAVDPPPTVLQFQKQALAYAKHFPGKPNVPAILYKVASLSYEFNHYDQALKQFWNLIEKYPSHQYTEYSAHLILDIHNLKKDFEKLKTAAQRLLQNRLIARSPSASEMHKILSQISLKSAERLAAEKKYISSAKMYSDFADRHTSSPLRAVAYYNAGVQFKKSGDTLQALSFYSRALARSRSGAELRKTIFKERPSLYQKTGQYKEAAAAFAHYAKSFPKDKDAVDFWYNAALVYDGLNRYSDAEKSYKEYFHRSKKKSGHQVFFLLAEMFRRSGQSTKALTYYIQFLNQAPPSSPHAVEATFYVAEIYRVRGQKAKADIWYKKIPPLYRRSGVGVFYAAQAQFYLVSKIYDELKKIKIPSHPARQQQAMQKKLKLFNQLKNDLKQVLRYDSGDQVVASLTLIGRAAEHLGDAIYHSPLPKGLNRGEKKKYREGLKKTAIPFKTAAINNYELAVRRAGELKAYNTQWLQTAVKRLAKFKKVSLAPDPSMRKTVFSVQLPSWSAQ